MGGEGRIGVGGSLSLSLIIMAHAWPPFDHDGICTMVFPGDGTTDMWRATGRRSGCWFRLSVV